MPGCRSRTSRNTVFTLLNRCSAQVFASQFDQVEGDHHRIAAMTVPADRVEHREAVVAGDETCALGAGAREWVLYGKTLRKIGFTPLSKSACSERLCLRAPAMLSLNKAGDFYEARRSLPASFDY